MRQLTKTRKLIIALVVIVVSFYGAIALYIGGSFYVADRDCSNERKAVRAEAQSTIDALDKIVLLENQPHAPVVTKMIGDCWDGYHQVYVSKEVIVNDSGKQLLVDLKKMLATQGYTAAEQTFHKNPCGDSAGILFIHEIAHIKTLGVGLDSYGSEQTNCSGGTQVDETAFGQARIVRIHASLR